MKPIWKKIYGVKILVCAKCSGNLYKCQGLYTCMNTECQYTHSKIKKDLI